MDWKLVCEVGFKVLTAAVAGAAVFVGISKAMTVAARPARQPCGPGAAEPCPGEFPDGAQRRRLWG